jgi:hypothetical protein
MYRMLAGVSPRHRAAVQEFGKEWISHVYSAKWESWLRTMPTIPPVTTHNPAVPDGLSALLDRWLSNESADRVGDATMLNQNSGSRALVEALELLDAAEAGE